MVKKKKTANVEDNDIVVYKQRATNLLPVKTHVDESLCTESGPHDT
jgi:hypothetical protein